MRYGALEVGPYIFSGNPDGFYALVAHHLVAVMVAQARSFEVVRHPIDFNHHSSRLAVEVENERPEWMLSPKLKSFGT